MVELEDKYAQEDVNTLRKMVLDNYGINQDTNPGKKRRQRVIISWQYIFWKQAQFTLLTLKAGYKE